MDAYNVVMEEPKRDRGRPKRTRYSKMISVRLTPKQVEWLEDLTERFQCPDVEVMRRALTEMARREGLNGGGRGEGTEVA